MSYRGILFSNFMRNASPEMIKLRFSSNCRTLLISIYPKGFSLRLFSSSCIWRKLSIYLVVTLSLPKSSSRSYRETTVTHQTSTLPSRGIQCYACLLVTSSCLTLPNHASYLGLLSNMSFKTFAFSSWSLNSNGWYLLLAPSLHRQPSTSMVSLMPTFL